MSKIHLRRNDETVESVIKATFPGFTGQRVEALIRDSILFYGTTWDEGSKRDYRILRLADMVSQGVPEEPYGSKSTAHHTDYSIPQGVVVVCWSRWGDLQHIEIYGPASNLTPMLEAPVTLTEDETTVLLATKSRKSSYQGIKDYRFHEARRARGITRDRWDLAKANLIDRKLLNRAGAITVDGRNALSSATGSEFPQL